MAEMNQVDQRERKILPLVAKAFSEMGYIEPTLADLAERSQSSVEELESLWETKAALFIAAIEFAYEAAERTWRLLLHPDNELGATERLLSFALHCGDEFTLSRLLMVGLEQDEEAKIRNTLRRLNRRLAKFLASEVTTMHVDALFGNDEQMALRTQAGAVLRNLAQIQQEADELADRARDELIEKLESEVKAARG